ncbi:MAG: family 20 glycosylhydrolase [Acidobacteriaceae bacterium]
MFLARIIATAIFFGLCLTIAQAQNAPLPIMPLPAHAEPAKGEFMVDSNFAVAFRGFQEPRLERACQRFLATLTRETGIPVNRLALKPDAAKPNFFINVKSASKPVQELGEEESYRLQITPTEVHLDAPNPLGALHGLQTFLQLVHIGPNGFVAPAVTIDDQPRFPWRGLMIDVSRHFMPIEVLELNLDGMEAVKMDVFHWHLSDNQGFRVESKKYPLLQGKGSDGLYYTQQQVKDLIEYARDRGIRVVPEFDMPGHTTAWFVGYPDLASAPGRYQIERNWGIFDPAMDPTRDSTYKFVDGLVEEMAKLFPDAYFHIGGDEVNGKQWDANQDIQKFMREHNLKSNEELQAYFSAKVQEIVSRHGKITMGWDEVLQPGTPKDVVIQSWRGQDSLAQAARDGHRGILSFGYYIDLMQPASFHYLTDPMAKGAATLNPEEQKRILGGEATMWSEYITPENIDGRIWPRTAAIAERLWSPQSVTDVQSMYDRLALVSQKLDYYGLQHNAVYPKMLRRMSGQPDIAALKVLGDVVEPPKIYTRGQMKHYDQFTPLNRMVDAVHPESSTARQFGLLVDKYLAKQASPEEVAAMQNWLTLWRANDAHLQPSLPQSQLTADLAPVSQMLAQVAQAGLDALGYLQKGGAAPAAWRDQQIAAVKKAAQPQSVLLNMIAPQVSKLVEATAPQ